MDMKNNIKHLSLSLSGDYSTKLDNINHLLKVAKKIKVQLLKI